MNPGQTRVLVLLLIIMGLEIAWSEPLKAALAGGQGNLTAHELRAAAVGYGAGGLALLALGAWAPNVATWIAVLFLVLMLFNHANDVAHATGVATNALGRLAGSASPLDQGQGGGQTK